MCRTHSRVPGFELFVAGQSGNGAVEDNQRLCEFIYRTFAISHPHHSHPGNMAPDIPDLPCEFSDQPAQQHASLFNHHRRRPHQRGCWQFNTRLQWAAWAWTRLRDASWRINTAQLEEIGKYALTIWPYHATWRDWPWPRYRFHRGGVSSTPSPGQTSQHCSSKGETH